MDLAWKCESISKQPRKKKDNRKVSQTTGCRLKDRLLVAMTDEFPANLSDSLARKGRFLSVKQVDTVSDPSRHFSDFGHLFICNVLDPPTTTYGHTAPCHQAELVAQIAGCNFRGKHVGIVVAARSSRMRWSNETLCR